jgi:hypothetical protein
VEENMRQVFGATPAAMAKAFTDAGKELPPAMAEAQRQREARRKAKARSK